MNHITLGFLASLIAGCATGIGAIPVLFFRKQHFSHRLKDLLLGFAAGVMLAATAFSLLVPAIAIGGVWIAVIGIIIGALLLDGVDKAIPHEHFEMGREGASSNLRRIWLFVLAVTIHNFPEGIVTFLAALQEPKLGVAIAIAVALHNSPEGIRVSVPIFYATGNRKKAFLYSVASGLAEPLGAILTFGLILLFAGEASASVPQQMTGIMFGAVAGVMVYISVDELLPISRSYGRGHDSILGLMAGMALMALSLLLLR